MTRHNALSTVQAYITGPPDQIEACMQSSAGREWVQVVTAP
jgi:hypothetical protein